MDFLHIVEDLLMILDLNPIDSAFFDISADLKQLA
jgi:hypothetical protein